MYYFVGNNGQQNGPVPAETLKDNGVTLDTLVWCEGMAGWTKVADVEELAPLFAPPAPPTPPVPPVPPVPPATPVYHQSEPVTKTENTYTDPTVNQNIRPDTYLVWSILATLFCCLPFGIAAIVNASNVEKLWYLGEKEEAIRKSENAKKWCWVSFGCGIAYFIIMFIIGFASGF